MPTMANPFDCKTILEGIRRWVEVETPTEAPEQVNKLATLVADGIAPPARQRRATRPTRGSAERRLTAKKQRSATKRLRSTRPGD